MAKCPLLSAGKEKGKRFDFTPDDGDFEEHTQGFVPTTTAPDTQKCVKVFEDWKKDWNSLFPTEVPEVKALALPFARGKWGTFCHSLPATGHDNSNLTAPLGRLFLP